MPKKIEGGTDETIKCFECGNIGGRNGCTLYKIMLYGKQRYVCNKCRPELKYR